jgi:outer membrane protease
MKLSDGSKATVWRFSLGLAGAALFCAPQQAQAVAGKSYLPSQLDLSLGLEAMTGDTNYSIGGNAVLADGTKTTELSPTSKLEWPLDIWLTRLDAGLTFSPAWRVNGTVKTNLGEPNDRIIDRDWLTPSMPNQVDVYSESKVASFDALIIDLDLEWNFWQQGLWSLYAGAGYQQQHFQYTGSSAVQYSPSGLPDYNASSGGETAATYDLTCSIPYLLLGSEYQLTPQLRLTGNLSFAPLIGAEDETVLLLRNRIAKSDTDGTAWLFDLSGIYYLTPWWHLKAGLHQTWINVDGEQHQTQDGQALGKIDMEGESRQTSGYLNVGYSF